MRKLMLLVAMLALALVAAAPATAQLAHEFEQEDVESGGAAPEVEIANKGNNVNLCAGLLQSAQSGNVQNVQGVLQYQIPEADDIGFGGSSIALTPEAAQECEQLIQQAAAAGPKAEAKAGKAEAKAEAKALPPTGGAGVAPLLALGAGALLVAGGLVARRIIR